RRPARRHPPPPRVSSPRAGAKSWPAPPGRAATGSTCSASSPSGPPAERPSAARRESHPATEGHAMSKINASPRVLLLGGRGYLAGHFRSVYPDALAPEVDVTDPHAVARAWDEARPEVVINCAGKTGRPNVDWCEDHRAETFQVNVTGALVALHACLDRGLYFVHVSSGCIYEGDNGGR